MTPVPPWITPATRKLPARSTSIGLPESPQQAVALAVPTSLWSSPTRTMVVATILKVGGSRAMAYG
jgi:hypothetical protein